MHRVDQRGLKNQRSDFLSAADAARFLGVKRQTLYAYASRGLVRSEPGLSVRGRRYSRSDLERLKSRGDARAGHGPVAAGALRWGEPVLVTAISSIRTSGPAYRGRPAVDLVRQGASFEAVAELLFTGVLPRNAEWPGAEAAALLKRLDGEPAASRPPLHALMALVPRLALLDDDRFSAPSEAEWARGRRLIRAMAAALAPSRAEVLRALSARTVAESLAVALGAAPRRAARAIEQAFILIADHELNASTFAARVVASTGADLYACVTGGLAALTGPRHGAFSDRVEALLDEIGAPEAAREVIQARTSRGEAVPGFGHPLYPNGDPRVPPLFELAERLGARNRRVATLRAVVRAMDRAKRDPPNVDLGLVAVVHALGLPRGSATAIFAVGRTAGWIAHALEQREAAYLLRPRAEYVGP
jgi:citrate synthase